MKKMVMVICFIMWIFLPLPAAWAHFGMVIPSDSMVMQKDDKNLEINLSFSHPFEMIGMTLDPPEQFFVVSDGKKLDLKEKLKPTKIMDQKAWQAVYQIKRPGAYVFIMTPQPYWEPAEDCFIVHYTKTVVAAFGDDEGWDEEIGLKTEIVPLSKPFGLYAGNVFQGIVKLDGKPVPYAEVEVEYYNHPKRYTAPTDYMVTQTIKADQNGVFTYAAPKAGWWGFAALNTSDQKIKHAGEQKEIEIGAVIWVEFHEMRP
jgi:cobalt/nickel transport protein